jgi:hypothetical protein
MDETERILQSIKSLLPDDFAKLDAQMKMHHLIQAANEVLELEGDWILVPSELTLGELLQASEK